MTTMEVERAQAELSSLIHQLAPGEELTITENGIPVATLTATGSIQSKNRIPGLWVGKAVILSEDDEHLKDFAEYME